MTNIINLIYNGLEEENGQYFFSSKTTEESYKAFLNYVVFSELQNEDELNSKLGELIEQYRQIGFKRGFEAAVKFIFEVYNNYEE